MRSVHLAAIALLAIASSGAGCFFTLDCSEDETCSPGSGTDGGLPPGCDPSQSTGPVADSCGVFVSPMGDDGNIGSKAKPVKTIGAALGKGTVVYACAGAMAYSEGVTVSRAAVLFGALDCASWAYNGSAKTQLTAPADTVPLMLASGVGGTEVHGFAITAADASKAGGSSIAVIDDHADALFDGVDLAAGAGAAGATGMGQAQVMTPTEAKGGDGTDDAMCNMAGPIAGGAGGKNMCSGVDTSAGLGGNGAAASTGGDGQGGQPMMMPSNAGSGQTATSSCKTGGAGMDGTIGTAGTGARGAGDISASGYQGPVGTLGMGGTPGQGGGGGGGARQCDMVGMFAGPSGGGGGAGGCPGAPGNPGQSGGSSIGILALGAKLTLQTVTITTRTGGAGGIGGDGQQGAAGGQPGAALGANACGGGKGGQGGNGGPGGGGAGGHSIAVAVKGGAVPDLTNATVVSGKGGAGGTGGDKDMTAQTKGDDGLACKALDFTNVMSPACGM